MNVSKRRDVGRSDRASGGHAHTARDLSASEIHGTEKPVIYRAMDMYARRTDATSPVVGSRIFTLDMSTATRPARIPSLVTLACRPGSQRAVHSMTMHVGGEGDISMNLPAWACKVPTEISAGASCRIFADAVLVAYPCR